jgi:D-amino-acid dehydrogenase
MRKKQLERPFRVPGALHDALWGGSMKILVLGAGVVGTAAAYYLARDGHEVTVVERHPAAARGTSYSNAGLVSPGDATAWASPAALKTFIRSLYTSDLGIKVRLRLDPYFYAWSLRFLRQCTTARLRANSEVKLRLALYSRQCINEISDEAGIGYDDRRKGILYFFRSQKSLDAGANTCFLAEHGLPIESSTANRWSSWSPAWRPPRTALRAASIRRWTRPATPACSSQPRRLCAGAAGCDVCVRTPL